MAFPTVTTTSGGDASAAMASASQAAGLNIAGLSGLAQAQLILANLLQSLPSGVTISAANLTGTTLASNVVTSSLTGVGTIGTGVWQGTAIANAFIASGLDVTKLTTGTTLPSNVVTSSLTAVGVLASPHMTGPVVDSGGFTVTLGTSALRAMTATTGAFSTSVAIGTGNVGAAGLLTVVNDGAALPITITAYRAANGAIGLDAYFARGSSASPTVSVSGDALIYFEGNGYDGAAFRSASALYFEVDAAPSSGIVPGRFRILTANSSGAMTEAARFDSAQMATFAAAIKAAGLPTSAGASGTLWVDGSGFVKRA